MVGQWFENIACSNRLTKIKEFNNNKTFEVCTDWKYLSLKTVIEQKPAYLLASIQSESSVRDICE